MIPLITVYSKINKPDNLALNQLEANVDLNAIDGIKIFEPVCDADDDTIDKIILSNIDALIILVGSGGTESIVEKIISSINCPILLLVNPQNNSLAAGLEIYGAFKSFKKVKLVYYENKFDELKKYFELLAKYSKINSINVLQIGEPSPWLLTSEGIKDFGLFKTGLEMVSISDLKEQILKVESGMTDELVEKWNSRFNRHTFEKNEIEKSARVYVALRHLIQSKKSSAVTVRCFDLLEDNVTACLALSLLNDEGVTAGCEGDLPALFTMLLIKELFNLQSWMANPSGLDFENNTFKLAHCTVPGSMLMDEGELDTHFESDKSLGLRGKLYKREITIARMGKSFDKIHLAEGEIIENDRFEKSLCRTQVTIKLNVDMQDWVKSILGNHQIIFYGHYAERLKEFSELIGIEVI